MNYQYFLKLIATIDHHINHIFPSVSKNDEVKLIDVPELVSKRDVSYHCRVRQPEIIGRVKLPGLDKNVDGGESSASSSDEKPQWLWRKGIKGFVSGVPKPRTETTLAMMKSDAVKQCLSDLRAGLQDKYLTEAQMIRDIFYGKGRGGISIFELDNKLSELGIKKWDPAIFFVAVEADQREKLMPKDLKKLAAFPDHKKNFLKKMVNTVHAAGFGRKSAIAAGRKIGSTRDKHEAMDAGRAVTRPRGRFNFQVNESSRVYMQTCAVEDVAPRLLEFLICSETPHIALPNCDFEVGQVSAVTDALAHRGIPLQSLDCKEAFMEVPAFSRFLESFIPNKKILCSKLTHLDLGSPYIRLDPKTARLLGNLLEYHFNGMTYLSLESMRYPEDCWDALANGLRESISLEVVNLADTQLGRGRQASCVAVCDALAKTRVKTVDFSGNFFQKDGLEALVGMLGKRDCCVKLLDLSRNVLGLDVVPPVLYFVEGLSGCASLEHIALADSNLSYEADIILEAVLNKENSPLKTMDLRGNPHGDGGLRSLCRIMLHPKSKIDFVDFSDFRDAPASKYAIRFHYPDPSGRYDLRLSHPQHRAVLVLLARRLLDAKRQLSDGFFDVKLDGKDITQNIELLFEDESGKQNYWQVNKKTGSLKFRFVFVHQTSKELAQFSSVDEVDMVLSNFFRSSKLPAMLARFAILVSGFKQLTNPDSITLFATSIAKDICLKPCQVKLMLRQCQKLFPKNTEVLEQVAQALLPALQFIEQDSIRDVFEKNSSMERFLRDVGNLFWFNPRVPTGRYKLDMSKPAERSALERLMVVDSWEKARATADNLPDVGQYGNHHSMRNVLFFPTDADVPVPINYHGAWALPFAGLVTCDYCSPFKQDPDLATNQQVLDKLSNALVNAILPLKQKVVGLRSVAHMFVVDPTQLMQLCKLMDDHHYLDRIRKEKSDCSLADAEDEESVKWNVEVFVMLFNRCTDYVDLLVNHHLYNSRYFKQADRDEIRDRLGKANTFDAWHFGELYKTNIDDLVSGMSANDLRDEFENSMSNCDLKIWEQWVCCKYIVALAKLEERENLVWGTWSEANRVAGRESMAFDDEASASQGQSAEEVSGESYGIPSSWHPEPPHKGNFQCIYEVGREGARNNKLRIELAVEILGWKVSEHFPRIMNHRRQQMLNRRPPQLSGARENDVQQKKANKIQKQQTLANLA